MHTPKQILGTHGEQLAAEFMKNKGYTIFEKNYRVHHTGEIDLIAQKGDEIVFIEVKTRSSTQYGYPEEAVDYWKAKKISKSMRHFLHIHSLHDSYIRFDVISVYINEKNNITDIRHNENVILPTNY